MSYLHCKTGIQLELPENKNIQISFFFVLFDAITCKQEGRFEKNYFQQAKRISKFGSPLINRTTSLFELTLARETKKISGKRYHFYSFLFNGCIFKMFNQYFLLVLKIHTSWECEIYRIFSGNSNSC